MGELKKGLHSYPKVYNLGHKAIYNLLDGEVVVQEKVDGSQFSFGVVDGALRCRSKGKEQHVEHPDGLFEAAVETAKRLYAEKILVEGWTYRGEVLAKRKHNTITYGRVPKGNVILFDVDVGLENRIDPYTLKNLASNIGLEAVPYFYIGRLKSFEEVKHLLEEESVLGGNKVEGIVIKNYNRFGVDGKMLMGKYVSEAYKELNKNTHRVKPRKDIIAEIVATLKNENRWYKAVSHLRDDGLITDSPADIGKIIPEVYRDIEEECKEIITEALFDFFWRSIKKGVTMGLPEWYKELLAKQQFVREPDETS